VVIILLKLINISYKRIWSVCQSVCWTLRWKICYDYSVSKYCLSVCLYVINSTRLQKPDLLPSSEKMVVFTGCVVFIATDLSHFLVFMYIPAVSLAY